MRRDPVAGRILPTDATQQCGQSRRRSTAYFLLRRKHEFIRLRCSPAPLFEQESNGGIAQRHAMQTGALHSRRLGQSGTRSVRYRLRTSSSSADFRSRSCCASRSAGEAARNRLPGRSFCGSALPSCPGKFLPSRRRLVAHLARTFGLPRKQVIPRPSGQRATFSPLRRPRTFAAARMLSTRPRTRLALCGFEAKIGRMICNTWSTVTASGGRSPISGKTYASSVASHCFACLTDFHPASCCSM